MQAVAKLGVTITISQVGSETQGSGTTASVFPIGRTNEWQPAFAVDEDGFLHQLRTTLIQSLDACLSKLINVSCFISEENMLFRTSLRYHS